MKKIKKMENETIAKQLTLEQVRWPLELVWGGSLSLNLCFPPQLRREKIDLENTLEQEQEALVNRLWKRMDKLEAEKRSDRSNRCQSRSTLRRRISRSGPDGGPLFILGFVLQDPPGEAGPARVGPSLPQRRLHGDRLAGEHDAAHPLPEERGGEAEEEPAHHRAAAYVSSSRAQQPALGGLGGLGQTGTDWEGWEGLGGLGGLGGLAPQALGGGAPIKS